jgi:hypothetical protein
MMIFAIALLASGFAMADGAEAGYYLKDGSGKAVYLAGYPSVYLVDRPGGGGYQSMHSALQQYGVNKYRAWPLHGWFRYSDVVAGKREIVYNVNSAGKADLTSFNTRTLGDLRNAVADAGSKGIYVEISLFDDCSLEADSTYRWNAHPFNARNNVNGVFNFGESADNGSGFYNVNNPTLLYYQRLYVDKILEYTAGYDNVIYEVINEGSSYGSGAWDKYWVDYLKSKVGNKVAVNHDYTDYAAAGDGKVDMLNYHGYCVPAEWDLGSRPDYIRSRVSPYWGIKPQNYDEGPNMEDSIASGDYKYVRRMMWGSLTNASYFEINDNEPWNTGNPAYLDGKVLGLAKAQRMEVVAREAVAQARAHLEVTQKFYKAGTVAKYDLLRAETQLAQVQQNLVMASNGVGLAMNALNNLLGVDLSTTVQLKLSHRRSCRRLPASMFWPTAYSCLRPEH